MGRGTIRSRRRRMLEGPSAQLQCVTAVTPMTAARLLPGLRLLFVQRKRGMRRSTIIVASAIALASLFAVEGHAQTPGEFRIYEENDSINPFSEGTDRYYTQGLRLEWLLSPREADEHFLPGITHEDWCSLVCGNDAAQG